jgi:hypothetical protein
VFGFLHCRAALLSPRGLRKTAFTFCSGWTFYRQQKAKSATDALFALDPNPATVCLDECFGY